MYDEYLSQYTKYKDQYGSKVKVAIFLMVGIFYEMYDVRNTETGESNTSFLELVELLALKVSVKKGDGPGGLDGLVAGIPVDTVHKWAGRLTGLGWTVVLIDQVKNSSDKVVERKVSRVLTPGSHIEVATSADMFLTLVSIRETVQAPRLAIVAIDLTTGHLHTFETRAQGAHSAWTSNEIVQFMELYSPREVLWSIEGSSSFCESISEQRLRSVLGCQTSTLFHRRAPLNSGAWLVNSYKEEYIRKRCGLKSLLPTHSALYLSSGSHSETALVSLLYALEELWPSMNLGNLLVYPWIPGSTLRLGENALVQLHMIVPNDTTKQDVLSLFDKCSSPMGHRGLRERLLKPSADPSVIRDQLDRVEAWTKKTMSGRLDVMQRLRSLSDFHRVYRRLQQGSLNAMDLMGLHLSLKATEWIFISEGLSTENVQQIQTKVFQIFSVEKSYGISEDISLFVPGVSADLDSLETRIQDEYKKLNSWISLRAQTLGISSDLLKPEFKEKSLVVKGPKALLQSLKTSGTLPSGSTVVINKGSSYIESNELDVLFHSLSRLRESLAKRQSIVLIEEGHRLANEIFSPWMELTDCITQIDVNLTLARVALDLGYTRPTILEDTRGYLSIEGLRHPLLEAQDSRVTYVKHSIELKDQGWLLYGLNASGKSSLMRATGLAVLLAQGGSFVPASSMALAPFTSLHTRIINTDNLWMGLSSFAVEMSEMRDIFREAGPKSLVLGDELCSGTETTSATALVAAGLKGLLKRGAKFLFATHLHGLSKLDDVAKDPQLRICHLHVEYDRLKDKLIYHRTLREGSGSSLYGLEVAKAMRIPDDIMEDALRYRKQLTGEADTLELKGSSWNSSVIRKECEHCHSSFVQDLEVHHLRERQDAVNGFLSDGTRIHSAANLAVLCETCHDNLHRGELILGPVEMTSEGPERTVSVSQHNVRKSKWTLEEEEIIKQTFQRFPRISNASMSKYLLNEHEIKISSLSLRKFREV